MPQIYLSICGESAVGKITLIEKLLSKKGNLRKRFGIDDGTVDAYGVCFSEGERKRDPDWKAKMHQSQKDIVLFEWQYKDRDVINEFVKSYPNAEHRIVLIWRSWRDHWRDLQLKHPYLVKNGFNLDKLKRQWRKLWKPMFQAIQLQVELVNGSTPEYDKMDEWPE
jgi:hypothetical protein